VLVLLLAPALIHGSVIQSDRDAEPTVNEAEHEEALQAESRSYSCECGKEYGVSDRISGGYTAGANQYPWMVRMDELTMTSATRGYYSYCGGSLISDRHVLTAQHCIYKNGRYKIPKKVKVSVHRTDDPNDYEEVEVGGYEVPQRYATNHDIAILILKKPVKFDKEIHPICLPKSDELVYVGERVTHAGWGWTPEDQGQSKDLKHIRLTVSDANVGKNFLATKSPIVGGKPMDPCGGDSGGPLMHEDPTTKRWTIIGTVWKGTSCKVLGSANRIGYWAKVTAHLDWIKDVLAKDYRTKKCQSTGSSGSSSSGSSSSGCSFQDMYPSYCSTRKYRCWTSTYVRDNCKKTCLC